MTRFFAFQAPPPDGIPSSATGGTFPPKADKCECGISIQDRKQRMSGKYSFDIACLSASKEERKNIEGYTSHPHPTVFELE